MTGLIKQSGKTIQKFWEYNFDIISLADINIKYLCDNEFYLQPGNILIFLPEIVA